MMSSIYKETDKATARIVLKVQNLTFFLLMLCTTFRDNIGKDKQSMHALSTHLLIHQISTLNHLHC